MRQYKSAVGLTIHPTLSVQKVYVMPLLSTLVVGHTKCNTKRKIKSMLIEETLKWNCTNLIQALGFLGHIQNHVVSEHV